MSIISLKKNWKPGDIVFFGEWHIGILIDEKVEGTDSLDVQMAWDVNLSDATPTELNASALPIISITTGTEDVSFAEYVIPPDSHVWFTTPAVITGRKPVQLTCVAEGYYTD